MKYSEIACKYQKISKNQASAGEKLIDMINFKGNENILDLGCGTGSLTFQLSKKTQGVVVGIDSSEGMIQQAKKIYGDSIEFICQDGESINFYSKFDIVFCNSVFHWFKDYESVLKKINNALNIDGIFALQTPVKKWCDFLVDAIETTCNDILIKKYMAYYNNPWFHLQDSWEYQKLLENNGFNVKEAQDETVTTSNCDLEKIIGLFNSGPAMAYLNPENYSILWDEKYKDNFIKILTAIIKNKMDKNKKIDITYNRAFLIAKKIIVHL